MRRFSLVFYCVGCLFFSFCKPSAHVIEPFLESTSHLQDKNLKPFYHGVASGDPLQNSVIIWTRVTPETSLSKIEVKWEVSTDKMFNNNVLNGIVNTYPEKDYTIKVDVTSLLPGTTYYYRFKALDGVSPIGITRTSPESYKELKFAIASCSNYEFGYFNAYGRMAEEPGLDAIIHLGDYIYEYGEGVYGDTTIGRVHIPKYEILSLSDYRSRYSQYRLDPDLQAAHRNHPFITIWDDHEITDNAYVDGANNHQEDEGDYQKRKAIAKQVYYEWMPIRDKEYHYRKLSFGNLADLFMLDERLAGRTKQAEGPDDPQLKNKKLLGDAQMTWFEITLKNSNAQWKIIGNQVIYSYLDWGYPEFRTNMDSWDGYPTDQQKVADIIKGNSIENVIFVTGDTHRAWAFEATNEPFNSYNPETAEGAFAVEFGVSSINSANADERFSSESVRAHEKKIMSPDLNPHLKFTNMRDHGYLLLTLTEEEATANFKIVNTNRRRDPNIYTEKVFSVMKG
ncbi:MAG: phosphodiesterase, partial [Flavobacteriaceae bacterium]|nr:phosphodiesterase [Flavobacteriaceae bacterium]